MNHTPGPWTGFLDERDNHAAWLIGPSSARPIVAAVAADAECGLTGSTVEANARLIAAAPELLAALHALTDEVAQWHVRGDGAEYDMALDAIAKAEGRHP